MYPFVIMKKGLALFFTFILNIRVLSTSAAQISVIRYCIILLWASMSLINKRTVEMNK